MIRFIPFALLLIALLPTGCKSDPEPTPPDGAHESDATRAESQTHPEMPAPKAAPQKSDDPVVMEQGKINPIGRSDGPQPGFPGPKVGTQPAVVFNQVLGRMNDGVPLEENALIAAVEKATGAKVVALRKGPRGLFAITFEATDPPRDAAAQKKLVEAMRTLPQLKYAEPERMLKPKGQP
jgi:hypothetical protein